MLPQTHFLFAFLLGLIGTLFGYLTIFQAFVAGIISIFIDLDSLIHLKYGGLKDAFNKAIIHHEHELSLLHRWPAFIVITIILTVLGNFYWTLGLILAIAYYTHFLLDRLHVHTKKKLILRGHGFVMPIFYFELILQAILLIIIGILFYI